MAQNTNGEMWINPTTETVRFKTADKIRSLIPEPIYSAGASITAGMPLSINSSGKVIPLSTDTYTKCIGIAKSSVSTDQDVEIITSGKVKISTALFSSLDPILDTLGVEDIGKVIYASQESGKYTLSRETAVLNNRNVIELGTLISYDGGAYFYIQIQLSGDGRGPVGITQVEYTLSDRQVVHNNSVKLPPKLYAIGNENVGNVYNHTFSINTGVGVAIDDLDNEFIVFSTGYYAVGFYFTTVGSSGSAPNDLNTYLNSIIPSSNRSTHEIFYNGSDWIDTDGTYAYGTPISYDSGTGGGYVKPSLIRSFIDAILTTANNKDLFGSTQITTSLELTSGTVTVNSVNEIVFTINGTENIPIYVYFSGANSNLNGIINKNNTYVTKIGNSVNSGKAVLADNRFIEKSNLIGFIVNDGNSTTQSYIDADSSGLFQKLGQISGFSGLTPGLPVYLGQNGAVSQSASQYAGLNTIQVGLALSATTIDANFSPILESPELDFPTGAVLKLATGITTANYGYLLCNGATISKVSNTEYTEVVDYINKINGSSGNTATLPNLNSGGNYYQIKVLRLGGAPKYPSAFQFSDSKTRAILKASPYSGSWTIDYTNSLGSLVDFQSANLSRLLVKFFLKKADDSLIELQSGVQSFSSTTYGFTVSDAFIEASRTYAIKIDFVGGTSPVFGYVTSSGTLYQAVDTDTFIVQLYRAENYEYFGGPELISLRSTSHTHTNKPNLDSINQDLSVTSSVKFPQVTGGSLVGSTLTLKSTSGIGSTDAIIFQVGNNGATEAMRILNAGNVTFGGSIGLIGTRVSKGWFTDLEITNLPSINGIAINTTAAKLNYLTNAGGTTGTDTTNIVFSTSPTLTTPAINTSLTLNANANLTMSSGTGVFSQTFTGTTTNAHAITANSLTTGKALTISANSLTSGSGIDLVTAASSINSATTSNGISVSRSGSYVTGAHVAQGVYSILTATGTVTKYAGRFESTGTGTANYGVYANASGGTANYSLYSNTGLIYQADSTDNTLGTAASGSIQTAGGVGIAKNLTVGTGLTLNANANLTMTSGTGIFTQTYTSTTATTSVSLNHAGAKSATFIAHQINGTATSSTNTINKTTLDVESTGTWNGTTANNYAIYSNATGGTTNYSFYGAAGLFYNAGGVQLPAVQGLGNIWIV